MGGLDVTDITREIIPLLYSLVRERALVKDVGLNVGGAKYPCVYIEERSYLEEVCTVRIRQEVGICTAGENVAYK